MAAGQSVATQRKADYSQGLQGLASPTDAAASPFASLLGQQQQAGLQEAASDGSALPLMGEQLPSEGGLLRGHPQAQGTDARAWFLNHSLDANAIATLTPKTGTGQGDGAATALHETGGVARSGGSATVLSTLQSQIQNQQTAMTGTEGSAATSNASAVNGSTDPSLAETAARSVKAEGQQADPLLTTRTDGQGAATGAAAVVTGVTAMTGVTGLTEATGMRPEGARPVETPAFAQSAGAQAAQQHSVSDAARAEAATRAGDQAERRELAVESRLHNQGAIGAASASGAESLTAAASAAAGTGAGTVASTISGTGSGTGAVALSPRERAELREVRLQRGVEGLQLADRSDRPLMNAQGSDLGERLQRFAEQLTASLADRAGADAAARDGRETRQEQQAALAAGARPDTAAQSSTHNSTQAQIQANMNNPTQTGIAPRAEGADLLTGERLFNNNAGREQWGETLTRRISMMAAGNNSQAQIQLDPPELGKLMVQLQIKGEQATVSFASPHAVVRDTLESTLPRLQEMLAEQGLDLVDVDVSDQSFAGDREPQSGAETGLAEAGDDAILPESGTVRVSDSLIDYYA